MNNLFKRWIERGLLAFLLLLPLPTGASSPEPTDTIAPDRAWFGYRSRIEEIEPSRNGARVVDITPQGPADLAGLRPGDLILSIDGREINARNEVEMVLADNRLKAGRHHEFTIVRNDERLSLQLSGLPTNPEKLRKLSEWLVLARELLEESGELILCDGQLRPAPPGTLEPSPFWQQLLRRTRSLETETILRVHRQGDQWTASSPQLRMKDRRIDPTELLPGFATIARNLEDGASFALRMAYDPLARNYQIEQVKP